jgi:hypothetical protein
LIIVFSSVCVRELDDEVTAELPAEVRGRDKG